MERLIYIRLNILITDILNGHSIKHYIIKSLEIVTIVSFEVRTFGRL